MLSTVLCCTFAVLLLGGASGQKTVVENCPSGWIQWSNQFCYLFVNTSRVTWVEAQNECQDRQAHLLRIETLDEWKFVRKAWESIPSPVPNSDMYWTALNNLPMNEGAATNPVFMWGDDEFPLDTVVKSHWDKEPDNTRFKNCAYVNVQAALSMAECSDRRPYICEYQLATNEICPVSWVVGYKHHYCYQVSNASNPLSWVNWNEARKSCEDNPNRKTRLLTITSKDVQNFLIERLPSVYNGRMGFWTALNDKNREGTFLWAGNGGTSYNVNNFDGMWLQEPNNLGGNEHCGCILPHGLWNDRNCEDHLNYACRMALPSGSQAMNFGCGSWRRAGSKCVHVFNTMKTWTDARQFCQNGGGDLLSFASKTDADWLTLQAQNNMEQRRHPGYWIGLNDRQTEGTYVWADGTQPLGYLLNWDKEPNNNNYCSTMNDGGFFADFRCFNVHAGTVCEDPVQYCAPGWTPFNGHCYKVDMTWKTYSEARDLCNSTSANRQGRLFALNSAAEKNWILSHLPGNLTKSIPHRFWSGLVNRDGWVWENAADQDPLATQKLVKWSLEPNNRGNEDCVEILANGHLNDAICEQTRGFICQKTPILPSNPPQTVAPGRKTVAPGRKTVAPGRKTVAPGRKTVAPGGKTVAPGGGTVAPGGITEGQGSHNAGPAVGVHMSAVVSSLLAPMLYRLLL